MSKIAAIGPDNLFGGFRAWGIDVLNTNSSEEAKKILERVNRTKEYEIIFLFENFAVELEDLMGQISHQTSPSLVVLPGIGGTVGFSTKRINDLVQKAAGQSII